MHTTIGTDNAAPRNQLAQNVAHTTMTSREIADLVEKRHDNVKRTIEDLAAARIVHPQSEDEWGEDAMSRPRATRIYRVSKRDSFVIVARLCPEFTARLVDRWQELEALQANPVALPNFASPADAARAWAEQFEQRQAAEQALVIAAPKVEFVDRYVDSSGSMGFRQVAKLLKAKEHQLREMLISKGVMYYLAGSLTPYQHHIEVGRFEIKTGTSEHNSHAYAQARFTAKGVQWVTGLWAKYQMEPEA